MQRPVKRRREQLCQRLSASRRPRLFSQILKDLSSVVGAAKECPVDALCCPPDDLRIDPCQQDAKTYARGQPSRHSYFHSGLNETLIEIDEEECGAHAQQEGEKDEAALHEHVSGAPFQEHRNLHHPMPHDCIRKRKGQRQEKKHRKNLCGREEKGERESRERPPPVGK